MYAEIFTRLECSGLKFTIEYLGEDETGHVCVPCGGKTSNYAITRKRIFGRLWEVGKPQEVSIDEFDKYMMTGLFKKL